MTWIQTAGGGRFDYLAPSVDDVYLDDVVNALSNICRYTGHCRFYSVLQHSVNVAALLSMAGMSRETVLAGLLHDAHEAYTGDVNSPLKIAMRVAEFARQSGYTIEEIESSSTAYASAMHTRSSYDLIDDRVEHVVREAFGIGSLPDSVWVDVKAADHAMLKVESEACMVGGPREDWSCGEWDARMVPHLRQVMAAHVSADAVAETFVAVYIELVRATGLRIRRENVMGALGDALSRELLQLALEPS